MYNYFILGLISLSLHKSVDAITCNQDAELVNTCTEENKAGESFNIYHTSTLNLTHDTSCSCSITGLPNEIIKVAVTNTPGFKNCGSSILIFKSDKTGYAVACADSATEYEIPLTNGTTINVVFKTTADVFSSSGFCIFVQDTNSSNMIINCGLGTQPSSTTSTISTSSTKESAANSSITTEQKSTKALVSSTSASIAATSNKEDIVASSTGTENAEISNADSSTYSSSKSITTTWDEKTSKPQQKLPLQIIIPAAGGGFLLVLVLIVAITCARFRKQKGSKEMVKSDEKDNRNSNNQSRCYENQGIQKEDDNEMRVNSLYESSDDIQIDVNDVNVEVVDGGYSEVKNILSGKSEYNDGIEISSQVNRRSRYNDYTDIDLPVGNNQKTNDVVGNSSEIKYSSQENADVANGNTSINSEETEFPVYAMPIKDSTKSSKIDTNNDEGPVYAYPIKQKKIQQQGSKTETKIKPKPMPKPTKLQQNKKSTGIVNADGLLYSDIHINDNDSGDQTKDKPFTIREKTDYAEIINVSNDKT